MAKIKPKPVFFTHGNIGIIRKKAKSLVQIRIKALNVKKGALQKLGFYLGTFSKHVLVSQSGLLLCKYHTAIRAYVPLADVAVECATVEHIDHINHFGHIPLADITIEVAFIEHPVHVSHV